MDFSVAAGFIFRIIRIFILCVWNFDSKRNRADSKQKNFIGDGRRLYFGFSRSFFAVYAFLGEAQISQIVSEWTALSFLVLLSTAVLKIFLTRLCFLTGWRGGHIFPIIFAGIVFGYAVSKLIPIDPTFCALICSASATYMVLRKPAATVLVFMILAPIEYLIPLSIAVIICTFIPFPKIFERAEEKEIKEELENKKRIQIQEIEKNTMV